MSTLFNWNKYMNLLHEFALVEDDLRSELHDGDDYRLAQRILFERFGHDG